MTDMVDHNNTKQEKMRLLVRQLNEAASAYYNQAEEIMSNFEYDKLYDELQELEKTTGIVFEDSPTKRVGYEVKSELTKVTHEYPMLSLDKTKEVSRLISWLQDKEGMLSWKLDGLTTVLTYDHGQLVQAVTRGNGVVGEDITHNAKVFANIPLKIPFSGKLTIRGESVIQYTDFERINKEIIEAESKYKNPRNLCSGTVRQLNSKICATRNVHFFAFQLVDAGNLLNLATIEQRFEWLKELGFDVVEHHLVTAETLADTVELYRSNITNNDFPSDGLVLSYNDIAYGKSLGRTAKFPKDSIAFKWKDEVVQTTFRNVWWSASRTGLINPVAVFDPVEIEGTTVSRASLHNVSILESYELGEGDTIEVFKANMIIPQLAGNITRSNTVTIPELCPVCHQSTAIRQENDVKVLFCPNPSCPAKKIKQFAHFAGRDAMNIDGLSEATLEKFIQNGFLSSLPDLYTLSQYKEEIVVLEGFGERSYQNLIQAIEQSRNVKMPNFLYSLGIANIGLSNAKLICRHFENDLQKIRKADEEELVAIDGVGELIAGSFVSYFSKKENQSMVDSLLQYITFLPEEMVEEEQLRLKDKTFVITGNLDVYENRNAMKEEIERFGGKVTGSVSKKTDYLINNDINSNSSKNNKAKELNIPIITEQDFIKMIQEGTSF